MIRGGLVRLRRRKVEAELGGPEETSLRMDRVRLNIDEDASQRPWYRPGPIMGTILLVGIIWISTVCWLVSRMPDR